MGWSVLYGKNALKQLRKLDRFDAKLIFDWIDKNLDGCEDPRLHGKALTGNRSGYWRYRVGNYRILCVLHDDIIEIEVVTIGHRRDVYR